MTQESLDRQKLWDDINVNNDTAFSDKDVFQILTTTKDDFGPPMTVEEFMARIDKLFGADN